MIFMYNIDDFDVAELKMFIFGEKAVDVEQNKKNICKRTNKYSFYDHFWCKSIRRRAK